MLKTTLLATTVAFLAVPALAESLMIKDAYARSSRPNAPVGAAFMQIMNHSDADDRLVSVSSDVANRVELHTHRDLGDGVMQMTEVENGFVARNELFYNFDNFTIFVFPNRRRLNK